jgi:hypothetical protein
MRGILKWALLLALMVTAIQVFLYGERGAYDGLFVRLGLVSPGPADSLKDRVTNSLSGARDDIHSGAELAERHSNPNNERIRKRVQGYVDQGANRTTDQAGRQ